jgi:hypothetical protein
LAVGRISSCLLILKEIIFAKLFSHCLCLIPSGTTSGASTAIITLSCPAMLLMCSTISLSSLSVIGSSTNLADLPSQWRAANPLGFRLDHARSIPMK